MSQNELDAVTTTVKKYLTLVESEMHVSFKSDQSLSIIDFVSCFECRVRKMEEKDKDGENAETVSSSLTAVILPNLSEAKRIKLGTRIIAL